MKRAILVCAIFLLMLAGCTRTRSSPTAAPRPTTPSKMPSDTHSSPTAQAGPIPLGRPGCEPPSPITRGAGFPEVEGSSTKIQLWGLIMAERADKPLRVNEQVKIVWRITGSGELRLTSIAPDGRTQPLQWGPDMHLSSTYARPGEEWGGGYLFTQPGCWDLHANRGDATADVWLNVAR
ncbi:MAG: hypothetical protein JWP07_2503 [Pseudonocardiales bacterium]|jgi:hypothetical protein|nr:hypothetical protein [Pseudonocardiales bacterium]